MRKVLMIMFMTLDGVAEFPVYGEPDDEDPMWAPRMKSIDTIILGAGSYRKWAAHWPRQLNNPSASRWEKEFAGFAERARKVVFSKSLLQVGWANSELARGDPSKEVARLKSLDGKDMALGGGPRLAQSFLERGLVDEMLLALFPTLLGRGKPMFRVESDPDIPTDFVPLGAPGRRDFRLLESKPLTDGTLFLHYERRA